MNIGIIGTGNVGSTLAKAFAKAGHKVFLSSRDPMSAKVQALKSDNISVESINEAKNNAEVLVIATPARAGKQVAQELGDLAGKTVIDATNEIFGAPEEYSSTAKAIISLCNTKEVVKCFNITGASNMANPDFNGTKIDMFVAGDSKKGKEIATKLAKDIGFGEVYDLGANGNFELIEQICKLWVVLAQSGQGRDMGIKILKR